mmetsp:Transcript_30199/g.53490  ORF Transcript_30199/g.53490 Transcript_30199/m.53490 type:complete len:235 (-) Transcript_30199:13-717(-)
MRRQTLVASSSQELFQKMKLRKSNTMRKKLTPEEQEISDEKALISCITAKYLKKQLLPSRSQMELDSIRKTAERLYENGFCQKFFEAPGTPVKIKRRKKKCVLHVTDLWGESQSKLLLKEIGFYSNSVRSLSSKASPPNEKVKISQSLPERALFIGLKPSLTLPQLTGEISPIKPKLHSARDMTIRFDKVITDCEREVSSRMGYKRSVSKALTPKKMNLKKSELKQISYYMSTL